MHIVEFLFFVFSLNSSILNNLRLEFKVHIYHYTVWNIHGMPVDSLFHPQPFIGTFLCALRVPMSFEETCSHPPRFPTLNKSPVSWKCMTQIHPSHFHFSDVFVACRAHVQAVVVSNVSRQRRSPLSIESFTLKMYPLNREELKGRVINAACLPRHAPIFNQHQQAAESTPPK